MKLRFFLLLILLSVISYAQKNYYSNPVKIPLNLSASFAELRTNHFHSGIDIKTNGTTGIPVNAVADGYISRIAVSPSGFGKALYINHPNGTTSVYAHLKNFREDITEYVKNQQYKNQSFRVDLQIPENTFKVFQNEIIAYSGNSGSSAGPHLHFEIRDTPSEEPLNPLQLGFPVNDKTPPKIFSLSVIPLENRSHVDFRDEKKKYPVVFYDGQFHISKNPVIPVSGQIGFAIQTNDYFDDSWNKCGIYSLNYWVDNELYFSFKMDRFSFNETRYLNSHIDFEEYKTTQRRYIRTWRQPGNKLRLYDYEFNRGIYNFTDGNVHTVKMELTDTYGNLSVLEFRVKSVDSDFFAQNEEFTELFEFNKKNTFFADEIQLQVPEDALYDNLEFVYDSGTDERFFSSIHKVHNNKTPLHKSAEITIKTSGLPKELHSKALLVKIDEKNGEFYSAGGDYKNGWVTAKVREFGNYAVYVDTIAPIIIPLSIRNSSELIESNRIRFKVSDELSGIAEIKGLLDGKWMLFDHDAKSHVITHYFDSERFELNRQHNFSLFVTDYKGNTKTYEASFRK